MAHFPISNKLLKIGVAMLIWKIQSKNHQLKIILSNFSIPTTHILSPHHPAINFCFVLHIWLLHTWKWPFKIQNTPHSYLSTSFTEMIGGRESQHYLVKLENIFIKHAFQSYLWIALCKLKKQTMTRVKMITTILYH